VAQSVSGVADVPVVMIRKPFRTKPGRRQPAAGRFLTSYRCPATREAVQRATSVEEDREPAATDLVSSTMKDLHTQLGKIEAEYSLECPVKCPTCREILTTVKAVRILRARVNFTSTMPRRGRLVACPHCLAVLPAELSNF
jgi:hypothetical protein